MEIQKLQLRPLGLEASECDRCAFWGKGVSLGGEERGLRPIQLQRMDSGRGSSGPQGSLLHEDAENPAPVVSLSG